METSFLVMFCVLSRSPKVWISHERAYGWTSAAPSSIAGIKEEDSEAYVLSKYLA